MKQLRSLLISCSLLACLFGLNFERVEAQEEKPLVAANTVKTEEDLSAPKNESPLKIIEKSIDFSTGSPSAPAITNRVGVQTAQTMPLSLNEAIRKALENNNDIEVARDDVRFQETQLRSLLGAYDPIFSVTPTFSRSSTTGSGGSNDFRLNAGFDKLLERGGGSINTFFNNSQTGRNSQNNTTFNQTSSFGSSSSTTFSNNLGVTYTQPLLRNFAVDNTRGQIRIQRKRLQQSDADFRRQTIAVISEVQRSYWDLVFALRDQQNRLANLNLARESLRQIEAKIQAGVSAPLARAEVATELANRESDVLLATQQVSITENNLKTLLLRDANAPEWTQSLVPVDKPVYSDDPIIVEDAIKDAMDNRPELTRLRFQKEINAIDINYFKNQTKPRIDLVSSFSLGGIALSGANQAITTNLFTTQQDLIFADRINALIAKTQGINPQVTISPITNPEIIIPASNSPIFGGRGQSFLNLFRADSPNYSVGITFQFPFKNKTAKANLAGARIQEQQTDAQMRAQEQTVVAEVRNAVQAVETARLRVLTSRRARENAEIQLEGERKLFEVGRSTTFLLFQRENALTNARNAEIRSETDYNKALSDLQRSTSTTFRLNNIQIDSPVDDK